MTTNPRDLVAFDQFGLAIGDTDRARIRAENSLRGPGATMRVTIPTAVEVPEVREA